MSKADAERSKATVTAENIGGISRTEVDIPPGVTVLSGRNATNRTSFLQSIMAVMGSDDVTLKGDADEGEVELALDGDTYRRTLSRTNGSIAFGGDPYLEDATLADLFAFLLESNEARQTVVQKRDLRELIMRPVDTDEIKAEIDRLERQRTEIDDELDELDSLKEELPSLEERKRELEDDIDAKREALAEKEAEIESADADVDETREEKRELESRLDDLRDLRSDLESVRSDIDVQEESIESLERELADLETEHDELPDTPMGEHEEIDQEISRLRERKLTLESEVSDLQDIIQFNEEMLDGEETDVTDALAAEDDPYEDLTDQLLESESTICWTCGSEVDPDRIEETVDTLRTVRQDQMSEIREIEDELDELRSDKRDREKAQRRRESLENDMADLEAEIDQRETRLEELRERRDDLSEEVEAVEDEVEALESEDFSEILDLHKEANQLEFELGQLESDLDDVADRIATVEDRLADEDDLRAQREEISEDLEAQRTRIDRIEQGAVEEFNDHMDEVLELLGYENLARIWIERVEKTVRQGRRKVEKTAFELHVVRTTDSGTTYEDTIDHLSESEREVTGLTFALAGYLVHDVHETVPFMLLDSLEAIDANRLADLVSYFSEYVQFLVVALLPEDAQALSDEYARVTEI
ncbi:chromosome segregation protein SMC [Halorientalis sp. IM1011]|uniref:archaea-specific SMC-related protein n=1 Tax=Halorientalis sp. IM1011 TaxID=1932360 RepID=UPI00097CC4A1|nr:archaea-specific SMC-related protein [Halorientalis sp. IM1011]AQL44346.1 chromosome segregation protein SMC [Halorientalis sp. IM1011]